MTWLSADGDRVGYEGTFEHDLESEALALVIDGGDFMPSDLDLQGLISWHDDGLEETVRFDLVGMWLGLGPLVDPTDVGEMVVELTGHGFASIPEI